LRKREVNVQIQVSARHTEIAVRDKDLIIEKIGRLGGKFLEMDRAEIHFSEERNPRIRDKEVCEITLEGHGHHVRCKSNGPDHITAVDRAVEKLENKLHKLKTKLSTHRTHRDVTRAKLRATADSSLSEELVAEVLGAPSSGAEAALNEWDVAPAVESEVAETVDAASEEATTLVDSYRIVKVKSVERRTLTPLDAAIRMDLVEHDFYFFTNSETGSSAVVYRRIDGDIGLIDERDSVS
jgi:putative sigma-54 modulation protein